MKLCFNFKQINKNNYIKFINKKNLSMAEKFKAVPFSERLVLLPHCMRNVKQCKAVDEGTHYSCVKCGGCKIAQIQKLADELGYKKLYVMKGGKAIYNILVDQKVKAVVAVACHFEGAQGIKMTDSLKVITQFVPLLKDGCYDTDVDVETVKQIMEQK
ncbi:MAG: DUF116 domain-containing protein [Elusimicrobia bacterium]|jgi:hypothetical protein|nr:DUF116 domain-containing protein [Elusimicrobiota bacterium]